MVQKENRHSLFLSALSSQNMSGSIPIWLYRQAGRYQPSYQAIRKKYSFREICLTPELSCQVTLLPIQEMALDAAIIFSDILFPLEALHLRVFFNEQSIPQVASSHLHENNTLGRVTTAVSGTKISLLETIPQVYEAISLAGSALGKTPLIGFSGAPWTLLTYVIEGKTEEKAERSILFYDECLELFESLFLRLEELVIEHLSLQIHAGCHAVQLFDSWASMVSDTLFEKYIAPSIQRIQRRLPCGKDGKPVPLLYFSKGMSRRLSSLDLIDFQAISCDTESSLVEVARWAEKHKKAVQGNFDPKWLTQEYRDKGFQQALNSLLRSVAHYPNYIFNLGHGIPKEAKYDTVRYLVEYVRHWSKR